MNADDQRRYERHLALAQIGPEGQARLQAARVTLVGCGGLGSAQAELLVRAGVGAVRLIDRDVVELSNLHRQILFDEEDARRARPKVEAAADRLTRINGACRIDARHTRADPETLPALVAGSDIVLDATDNAATRLAIDAACRAARIPWIFGGVTATSGLVVPRPLGSPCLRCLFGEPPAPRDEAQAIRTKGTLASAVLVVAALQATAAMKFLVGSALAHELIALDVWDMSQRRIALSNEPRTGCACVAR
ncbi:MAG: HesA/MoeB/ThiF family protein [Myxococcales bacterium]|jgi:adenylyltransferase/sulfurtransferase|nr:HesA/MoeB/ThiF family protein [Myxococcales bacterium]